MGLSVFLMAAGTALAAGSQMSAGFAAEAAAGDEANETQEEARLQATRIRRLAREYRAGARSDYAASGVVVDEGSPLEAEREITRRSEEDALFTIIGADRRAKSLREHGAAYSRASTLGALGTVLGGGAQIASGWKRAAGSGGSGTPQGRSGSWG